MSEPDRSLPADAARVLVELTERALAMGLDRAVEDARRQLGALSETTAEALEIAIASAGRALASRECDAADVDQLRALAGIDDLTGALNRRALFERLDEVVARGRPAALVLCDLDGLKAINDRHDHPVGDAALRAFVDLVGTKLRAYDVVGRIGGDEFALILPGASPDAVERILSRLTTTIEGGPPGVAEVRASFGTAWFPDDGDTRDTLVAVADRRLYEDKRNPVTRRRGPAPRPR
jgi:diguanylate cyclase (GGDEF)-like protein